MATTIEPVGATQPEIGDTGPSLFGGEAASFQAEIMRLSHLGGGTPIRLAHAGTVTGTILEGAELVLPRIGALLPSVGALASGVGAAAVVILRPTNRLHLQQGALPGHPDIGYRFYESEANIRFYRINPDGSEGPTLWSGPRRPFLREDGSLAVNVDVLRRTTIGDPVGPIIGGGLQPTPPETIEGLNGPIGGGFRPLPPETIEGLSGPVGGGFRPLPPETIEGLSGPIGGGYQLPDVVIGQEALVPPDVPDTSILASANLSAGEKAALDGLFDSLNQSQSALGRQPITRAEFDRLVSGWSPGTFAQNNPGMVGVVRSLEYHINKHAHGDPVHYLRSADNFTRQTRRLANRPDGADATRFVRNITDRQGNIIDQQYITIDRNGQIRTYGRLSD